MMPTLKELKKNQKALQAKIDEMISALDDNIDGASSDLANELIAEFVDALRTENGIILNDAQNNRLVSIIDKVFDSFNEKQNLRLVVEMVNNIQTINALNSDHFAELYTKPIKTMAEQIQKSVNNRFGINADGSLQRSGYMMGLLDDVTVRNAIKQVAFKGVQTSTGWKEFAGQLSEFIEGNKDKAGIFKRFYRNYAYDVYSQADRLNSSQYADRLKLNYAIYEGGIIKTSRKFCRERDGKVFTREEIMKFKLDEAAPPDYDPITDLGGYGCRHYLNWISEDLAFALRPDLRPKEPVKK